MSWARQQFEEEQQGYLGSQGSSSKVSGKTAEMVDEEIKKILDKCYKEAYRILEENRDKLEAMKDALMEYETIDVNQIEDIMNGVTPRKPVGWDDRQSTAVADAPAEPEVAVEQRAKVEAAKPEAEKSDEAVDAKEKDRSSDE